jgi:hypothetical protein
LKTADLQAQASLLVTLLFVIAMNLSDVLFVHVLAGYD